MGCILTRAGRPIPARLYLMEFFGYIYGIFTFTYLLQYAATQCASDLALIFHSDVDLKSHVAVV